MAVHHRHGTNEGLFGANLTELSVRGIVRMRALTVWQHRRFFAYLEQENMNS